MTDSREKRKPFSETFIYYDMKEGRKKKEERSELQINQKHLMCKDCRSFQNESVTSMGVGYCKKYHWFVKDDVASLGCEGFEKRS